MTAPVQDKGREALERMKRQHVEDPDHPGTCDECGHPMPCDMACAVAALEEALHRTVAGRAGERDRHAILSKLSEVR